MLRPITHAFWAIQFKETISLRSFVIWMLLSFPLLAAENPACPVQQYSLWEVSTRSMSCDVCDACRSCSLATSRYECGMWHTSKEELLIAELTTQSQIRTILYVHGNRQTLEDAREKAILLLQRFRCQSDTPIRMILFSWPSEKPDRILPKRIAEDKKHVIQVSGFYLAGLLARLPADSVESIIGFSFGCAVTSAALHLQAGGTLGGRSIGHLQTLTKPVRLGFIAPAFDRYALTRCGEYNQAPKLIDILVNLYNSSDPILRRFRLFERDRSDAAGFFGLVPSQYEPLAADGALIQFDCKSLGRTHAERDYHNCSKLSVLIENALGGHIEF